jgi:hypothetical protein
VALATCGEVEFENAFAHDLSKTVLKGELPSRSRPDRLGALRIGQVDHDR